MNNSSRNKILICVVGTSPAIITETLFALKDQAPFPTRIMVFTTTHGAEKINSDLVLAQIEQLCHDYNLPIPTLKNSDILIPTQSDGNLLDDIRTSVDQEAMADYLMLKIRELCEDDNLIIHASIAGGRKSMSFYMGYIFSFFARPQDSMSHVLIDSQYEKPGFWYPTPNSKLLEGTNLDAKDAKIELAEIPFLRLRDELGINKSDPSHVYRKTSYRSLLKKYNLALNQESIELRFSTKENKAFLNDEALDLSIEAFAFYIMIARSCKQDELTYKSPSNPNNRRDNKVSEQDNTITSAFIMELSRIAKISNSISQRPLEDQIDAISTKLEKSGYLSNTRLYATIKRNNKITFSQINNIKTAIKDALEKCAHNNVIDLCQVASYPKKSQEYTTDNYQANVRHSTKNGYLGLSVNPKQIVIE